MLAQQQAEQEAARFRRLVADLKAETGATRVEGYDLAPPYFLRVLMDGEVLQAGYGYWVKVDAPVIWVVGSG